MTVSPTAKAYDIMHTPEKTTVSFVNEQVPSPCDV